MQVKLREMTILDLQKKISEGDGKLKQQQTLCRSPRLRRLAPLPPCRWRARILVSGNAICVRWLET